jgi:general secretion pathway protein C
MRRNFEVSATLTPWIPRARLALEILLVGILGLFLARLVWILADPGGAASRPLPLPVTASGAGTASSVASADLMTLTRASRFGAAAAGGTVLPDAPATSLNLSLKGVRAVSGDTNSTTAGKASIAIIQTPDNRSLTYHPGDTIIDGVTLDRVLSDRVLIRKAGMLETLMMDSSIDALAVLSRPGEGAMIEGAPRPTTLSQMPSSSVDRSLFASLDVSPVFSDGILTGYRIMTPGETSALSGSGLESGDIITLLEGKPVGEIEIQDFTQRLSNAAELSMTVQRNGASVPVTLRFPEGD